MASADLKLKETDIALECVEIWSGKAFKPKLHCEQTSIWRHRSRQILNRSWDVALFFTKLECENVQSQECKRSSWELTEQAMKFFWFFLQLIRDVFQDVKTVWLIFRMFNYLKKTNPGWGSKGDSTGEGFLPCMQTNQVRSLEAHMNHFAQQSHEWTLSRAKF